MEKELLLAEIDQTTTALLDVLSSFTNEQFNEVPFAGSWTAGQVAEHVFKSESGVLANLQSQTRETERAPDEHVANLRAAFLNFNIKMKSPDFILPSDEPQDKEARLQLLKQNRDEVRKVIDQLDLTATCTGFAMPGVGALTRWEWANFMVVHSKRHIYQLQNILSKHF